MLNTYHWAILEIKTHWICFHIFVQVCMFYGNTIFLIFIVNNGEKLLYFSIIPSFGKGVESFVFPNGTLLQCKIFIMISFLNFSALCKVRTKIRYILFLSSLTSKHEKSKLIKTHYWMTSRSFLTCTSFIIILSYER